MKIVVTKGDSELDKRGERVLRQVATYTYTVRIFGIIIHQVTFHNLTTDEAIKIFGKKCPRDHRSY